MRQALEPLSRYVAVTRHSKHLTFIWLGKETLPDSALVVIAKDDDLTYGLVNSSPHRAWANALGTWLGVGNDLRYTPTTCFETFPFPCPTDAQRADIEKWAKYLDAVRSHLLKDDPSRTMTKLYNDVTELRTTRDTQSPIYPLLQAHEKLDAAVAAAYGWEWPMTDDAILAALLALNLERAAA